LISTNIITLINKNNSDFLGVKANNYSHRRKKEARVYYITAIHENHDFTMRLAELELRKGRIITVIDTG
jgi:hypothetical protein